MTYTIAIVGRPNVGKSTLFNRLVGRRLALVHDRPGVTRDWRAGEAKLGDLVFRVVDTAGLDDGGEADDLVSRMRGQTDRALAEADLALFVVDARAGLMPEDAHFARWLRKSGVPAVLVANKCEGARSDAGFYDAFALGLGEPVAISAEHAQGLADLHDAIAVHMARGPRARQAPAEGPIGDEAKRRIEIAIVGRPNVGKSTLANRLVGEERMMTGAEPGVTRDAVSVGFVHEGRNLILVDTAGLRRQSRVTDSVEELAVDDTLRAIKRCQVAIVVIDATEPMHKQDLSVADMVVTEGRAIVIAANKWDLVQDRDRARHDLDDRIEISLAQVRGVPVAPISASSGEGVDRLMARVFEAHERWSREIGTAALNRFLEGALEAHSPPAVSGRRLKFRYMTQIAARPPGFALFTNMPGKVPESYLRYLAHGMREAFDLRGVPIRLHVRGTRNPFAPGGER